jgi:peptidoglycan/xylan/chitin deacetylase (PgdA/CDA1 family)
MKILKCKRLIPLKIISFLVAVFLIIAAFSRLIPDGTISYTAENNAIGKKAIALTFDDGPGKETERLLDGLREYDAKASFFIVGNKAEKYPDTLKRAYNEGHLIGSHTYSDIDFYKTDIEDIKSDINKNIEVIKSITGEKPVFLRAPYGNITPFQLKQLDSVFIHWSASSLDWFREEEEFVYNRLMNIAKDGAIILLHDTRKTTVDAVLRALPELKAQGYEMVRVDELITRNGEEIKKGVAYRSCEYNKNAFAF